MRVLHYHVQDEFLQAVCEMRRVRGLLPVAEAGEHLQFCAPLPEDTVSNLNRRKAEQQGVLLVGQTVLHMHRHEPL